MSRAFFGAVFKEFYSPGGSFPPRPGTAWESHHAFGAWIEDTWLQTKTMEHYFGSPKCLEELVENGQMLQSEGYKCIFEEARRQKSVCSMALNWCYNEPWPTAANNSIIEWPSRAKLSYEAVKASCRPMLASAFLPKFTWKEGKIFCPELWVLNDFPEKSEGGTVEVYLNFGEEEVFLLSWKYPDLEPNKNIEGPVIRYRLPSFQTCSMKPVLRVIGKSHMNSEYTLLYEPLEKKEVSTIRGMNL